MPLSVQNRYTYSVLYLNLWYVSVFILNEKNAKSVIENKTNS